jgi:hypothetical protein
MGSLGGLARWLIIGYHFRELAEWNGEEFLRKESADGQTNWGHGFKETVIA